MFYELASTSWGDEELDAIAARLRSPAASRWASRCARFEEAFAATFGMKHAVMVNSGSSANLVGVAALFYARDRPLQRGDEVIVPAISWATTFHPLQQYGLRLRFVDVELDTLNMDVSQLEAALTPRTRMVVAVSILGNPAALDVDSRVLRRARPLSCSKTTASRWAPASSGRPCGTFGDVNTFSTFYSHHISTMEGGLLAHRTTRRSPTWRARSAITAGRATCRPTRRSTPAAHDDPFFEAYRFIAARLQRAAARDVRRRRRRAAEETRRAWSRSAGANAAHFVEAVRAATTASSFSAKTDAARGSASRIVLNPALTLDRARVMDALRHGGHRISHDYRRLLSAARGDQVLRLRHRRRHRQRQHRARSRLFRRQPSARPDAPRSNGFARCSTPPHEPECGSEPGDATLRAFAE